MSPRLERDKYTVGWVCALPVELAAAQEMLDEEHEDLEQDQNDNNLYSLGRIGGHNVVIVCVPAGLIGNNPAAAVAAQMRSTFNSVRFGLMVGIGGGVPSAEVDIRLGDVVVSQPHKGFGGVVQYDFGKTIPNSFERTGFLNSPPQILLSAVAKMHAIQLRRRSKLSEHLSKFNHIPEFSRDNAGPDILFEATYDHESGRTCESCSSEKSVHREPKERDVRVHYGTIASGNQVMRDGTTRDKLSRELGGVLCFEMEAAGLMNSFPCLVIRGICDYADSHKNKKWQAFAAGTAAACAKEVLLIIPPADVVKTRTVDEMIGTTSGPVRAPSYYIPFPRNRRFVGRDTELDALKQILIVNRDCQKLSVVGLGGIGKTQVALEFAYSVRDCQPDCSIFWIPALSLETFEQACAEIVRVLRIPQRTEQDDVKELVRQHLSTKRAGRWLLIVDNADDVDILFGTGQKGVVDYLPESEQGIILFTTRHQQVAVSLTGNDVIELQGMSRQEAVKYLEKSLIQKDLLYNDTLTTELLDELAYLPLAITQAAAYLNTNKISLSEYLWLLRNTEQDIISLMTTEFHDSTRYKASTNAVAMTWVVSFSQILKHDVVAADLLSFISCIEWKAIPRSILPEVQPEERMVRAIGTLCAYSFVLRRDGENEYDMHRLVHLVTRIWINQHGTMAGVREKAIRRLAKVFPYGQFANRMVWRAYLPHALRLLENKQKDVEERYELCLKVGQCLYFDGRMQEAVAWAEESYQWRRDNVAEEHPDRLDSQHTLAIVYRDNGQVERAIKLLEHLVAIHEKIDAEEHPDRLCSQHELAIAYRENGQVERAIKLLEHVVAVREKTLVEEHQDRLMSLNQLAATYTNNGQVEKGIKLLEYVVAVRKKILVEEHPHLLSSQTWLARAYTDNEQVEKAVKLQEHLVTVESRILGEEDSSRLASQYRLAILYRDNGQVEKAVNLLEQIVAVEARVLGEGDPERLVAQRELARAYEMIGQMEERAKLLEHIASVEARARG